MSITFAVDKPGRNRVLLFSDGGYRQLAMGLKLYELLGADDRRFSPYCWRTRMALAPLRAVLEHQAHFCGEAPAYADYIIFGTFQWPRSISPERLLEKDDILYAWRDRMLGLFGSLGRRVNAYPE